MLGLYIHIPYCRKKCHYCNFVITTDTSNNNREQFLEALKVEALHYKPYFLGCLFDTLYFGGGTPSVLDENEMNELVRFIKKNLRVKDGAEFTLEANPGDIDVPKAKALRSLGFNRVSLGAQSFKDETLRQINRAHLSNEIYASFENLRKAGFENINMDLILSLPQESLLDTEHSLKELLKLNPEHVSLYELTIEDKTNFGQRFKEGSLSLPSEEKQLEMLLFARNFLKNNGFRHYELLNYAKPGFESRHNQIYWANEEYLGLGPGAFSYWSGKRVQFSESVDAYMSKIAKDDWKAFEEEVLTEEKKERESFLLALRLLEGARLKRFSDFIAKNKETVDNLKTDNLLEEINGKLRLTDRGQLFAETVFTELSMV